MIIVVVYVETYDLLRYVVIYTEGTRIISYCAVKDLYEYFSLDKIDEKVTYLMDYNILQFIKVHNFAPEQVPLYNCLLDNCPRMIVPGQLLSMRISPRQTSL